MVMSAIAFTSVAFQQGESQGVGSEVGVDNLEVIQPEIFGNGAH